MKSGNIITVVAITCALGWSPVEHPAPTTSEVSRVFAAGPFTLLRGEFNATGTVQVDSKRIKIRWAHKPPGYANFIKTTELLATSFYPTAVCRFANDHILVAGKSSVTGSTIIEAWKLRRPNIKWNVLTNKPEFELRGTSRRIGVYDADVEGKRIVKTLMAFPESATHFLAQFADSKDIYAMTSTGAAPALVASFDPNSSGEYMPELVYEMDAWWGARHEDLGNIIVMHDEQTDSMIALVDDDLDFLTDYTVSLDDASFTSMGFGATDKYLDW